METAPPNPLESMMGSNLESLLDSSELDGVLENMISGLVSKDILFEPLLELSTKYPPWLKSHLPPFLSQSDYDRYSHQYHIIQQIVDIYKGMQDTESESDSNPLNQRVLELMNQMQESGNPPDDILAEFVPDMKLGENGLPDMNSLNPQDCNMM